MIKVFSTGLIVGLILTGIAAFLLPVTDLHREASLLSVQPNGGVVENFNIRLPDDRIIGSPAAGVETTPGNLKWPQELADAGAHLQVFKLRNEKDAVVGVASRLVGSVAHESGAAVPVTEWVLHLPARGSLYFPMVGPAGDNAAYGRLRSGTREFVDMRGTLTESVSPATGDGSGSIRLQTSIIATTPVDEAGEGE